MSLKPTSPIGPLGTARRLAIEASASALGAHDGLWLVSAGSPGRGEAASARAQECA